MHRILDFISLTPTQQLSSKTPSDKASLNPSIIIIFGVVLIVFVMSALLHLLLNCINRNCSTPNQNNNNNNEDDNEEHVATLEQPNHQRISSRRVAPEHPHQALINSLPLFSFDAVKGLRSADCAVCLSKFEPHDQLRLLPVCCHAFHSECVDTWLVSNLTCPLCRSTIDLEKSESYSKLFNLSSTGNVSFRLEIGNVSRRENTSVSDSGNTTNRSISMGSFQYSVENHSELEISSVGPARYSVSDSIENAQPPGSDVAAEVGSGGTRVPWLRDYVDKLSSTSSSFRFSGRFFTGSGRRTESTTGSGRRSDITAVCINGGSWDLEGNGYSDEINNFFRWLSGV